MAGKDYVTISGMGAVENSIEALVENYETIQRYVVVSDVRYSIFVEFGTSKMPANGALRAAIQEVLGDLETVAAGANSPDEITQNIAEAIKAGWRKDIWVDTGRLRDSITVEKA